MKIAQEYKTKNDDKYDSSNFQNTLIIGALSLKQA